MVENSQDVLECVGESLKSMAWQSKTPVVRSREQAGYSFNFFDSDVMCTKTDYDYKCVINVPVNNGVYNYTACYKVPFDVCESGAYIVASYSAMGKIGIEHFDNNCAPIYGQ